MTARILRRTVWTSCSLPMRKGTGGKFGLGLSIVYKVCTTYGYHVSAENLTEGVCFRIYKDEAMKPKKKRSKKQKKGNS